MRFTGLFAAAVASLTACGPGTQPSAPSGDWLLDHTESHGVLVSIWGASSTNLWAAGGEVDRGVVLHSDGTTWTEVETGATSLLWSIYGFSADNVYAVGEKGVIVHYDGSTWERVESGTDRKLYGLWGASADDVWIVGGDPSGLPGSGVILRGSGHSFRQVEDVPRELVPDSFFKVYGTGPRSVVVVGRSGTVLRWNGEVWSRDAVPTQRPIISLLGRAANDLYAVGGQDVGEILHYDGTDWSRVQELDFIPGLGGVFTAPNRPVFVVGAQSYILEISPDGTVAREEAPALDPIPTLHSVWGDEQGTIYAVGGDLLSYPEKMGGVIFRRQPLGR